MERTSAFGLAGDREARVLILGTHPSVKSLRQHQYYAHPRNQFWRLMGAVIGSELTDLAYQARLEGLRQAGVALSDVYRSAVRRGSLDAHIRNPEATDLAGLTAGLPALKAVAFNGRTAAKAGRRQLDASGLCLELIDLPSSSPAHARLSFEQKLARWSALARYLR